MRRITAVGLVALALVGVGLATAALAGPTLAGSVAEVEGIVGLGVVRIDGPAVDERDTANPAPAEARDSPTMVAVDDDRIWPYVGPDRSFDRRASSVNVVVRTDPATVRRYLAGERAWNRSDDEWTDAGLATTEDRSVIADERVPWRDAPGAPRYTYVAGEGWLAERYQLHRGTYFGSRHHVRAYGPPGGDWTAVQAHAEHWDWFTITHTVDSVERAQRRVEAAFLDDAEFEVRQGDFGNGDTYDADRWATVVALALVPLAVRRRFRALPAARTANRLALAGSLAALPLAVRAGGVLFERHLAWLSPGAVVAVWYPVLVAGIPVAAVGFGRRLPRVEAGALAGVSVGLGIGLDYAVLGIGALPIPVAVHRVAVAVAAGLLAAGADAPEIRWTPALRAGGTLWVLAVIAGHLV